MNVTCYSYLYYYGVFYYDAISCNFIHLLITEYSDFVLLLLKTLFDDYAIPFSLIIIGWRMGTWSMVSKEIWTFGNGSLTRKKKSQEYSIRPFLLSMLSVWMRSLEELQCLATERGQCGREMVILRMAETELERTGFLKTCWAFDHY